MKNKNKIYRSIVFLLMVMVTHAATHGQQSIQITDPYLRIEAAMDDPLYTTYAAAMERAQLYGDKAYKMVHYENSEPIYYESDQAGRMYNLWLVNKVAITEVGDFYQQPVVTTSFPDMVVLKYQPHRGLEVEETFMVHSAHVALVDMRITNRSEEALEVTVYPVLELGNDSLQVLGYDQGYHLAHYETRKRLISSLSENYPENMRNIFTANVDLYAYGAYKGDVDDLYLKIKTDYYAQNFKNDSLNLITDGWSDMVVLQHKKKIPAGETTHVRYIRGTAPASESLDGLAKKVEQIKKEPLQPYADANVKLFGHIPRIDFDSREEKLVYLSAMNLARGCMLPPEGETSYNYYVFSRNPLWGWGHGHQVLHESLAMLAYVYLDPQSAQESQRVYMEQQGEDGLIAYRHGPRGPQTYPHKGEPTTSAPFFSWINWEIYKVSEDKVFLGDAYQAGVKYVNWLYENRDDDKDGTFEWGPYGLIENVRDWYNVVFQVSEERHLDIDKEDISDELECLDLSLMIVKELRSLEKMATVLGSKREARQWRKKAEKLTELINERMWDEGSGFYYNINKEDHSFMFLTRDLKRQEIIGILPLWAEAAPKGRAEAIVKHLQDPEKFWRTYGVPTVAADDSWYSADVDYCCKWNGPVWLLWNYMVYDGLRNYEYHQQADALAAKMMDAVTTQLAKNHNFWESFSPDNEVVDSPSNYIWDAIMAKLLIDVYERKGK